MPGSARAPLSWLPETLLLDECWWLLLVHGRTARCLVRARSTISTRGVVDTSITMSAEGQEELLDYSDSEEIAVPSNAPDASAADKEADKKGSYVGIHATGFRDFLLKPELLRAIGDCGFEHPSEGSYSPSTREEMKAAAVAAR